MSSKLHIAVDALGNPLRVLLSPGQSHEMTQAEALIDGLPGETLIADTAYDADAFRARLSARGTTAVIPANRSRARPIAHDIDLYKERHLVECFINKIKQFRHIATRYEKLAANYLAMIKLAAVRIWLNAYESTA